MYNLRMNKIVVLILSVSVIFQACTVSLEVPDNFAQEIGNNIALNDSSNDQVEILKNKIIPIKINVFNKINIGFLLCTGNLINFTFFLSINFNKGPPLVTMYDLAFCSCK